MEKSYNEIFLLSDILKNESIDKTSNLLIQKYDLNNYIYKDETEVFEIVGELNINDEDIWKNNINNDQKLIVTEEILFDIYKKLYNQVDIKNKTKLY